MLAIVGAGSFIFHASLLYSAQLSDELPMILFVSFSLFILFDTATTNHGKGSFDIRGNARSQATLLAILAFDVLFTYS